LIKFIRKEEKCNIYYYYDVLENRLVKTDCEYEEIIDDCTPEMEKMNHYPPIFDNECYYLNTQNTREQLILSITEHCNLRCKYCIYFEERYTGTPSKNTMSFETAKKAIDNFINNSVFTEDINISFYGGEPLSNLPLIKQCISYIENKQIDRNIRYSMTSNGVLLTLPTIDYLVSKNFLINISLDGPEDIHDRYRLNKAGKETYALIMNNILEMKKKYPKFWKENLSFTAVMAPPVEPEKIFNFFEFIDMPVLISDIEITDYMKNYLHDLKYEPKIDDSQEIKPERYPKLFKQSQSDYEKTINILKEGRSYSHIPGGYCLPFVKKTFVDTEGNYYLCEKIQQRPGNILGNVIDDIDYSKIFNLRDRINDFSNKHCRRCWVSRFCDICYIDFTEVKVFRKCSVVKRKYLALLKAITYRESDMEDCGLEEINV
jgi:uncharacterized protein